MMLNSTADIASVVRTTGHVVDRIQSRWVAHGN